MKTRLKRLKNWKVWAVLLLVIIPIYIGLSIAYWNGLPLWAYWTSLVLVGVVGGVASAMVSE